MKFCWVCDAIDIVSLTMMINWVKLYQNYYEMLMYSGAYSKTNPESLKDWQTRGPYYYYSWPITNT